jgi:DUF1680 family protein
VISRQWKAQDQVELDLDMPIDVVYSNPKITGNLGRAVLRRGPVVYALEETDQSCPVRELLLMPENGMTLSAVPGLPEGTPAICGKAVREFFDGDELYTVNAPQQEEVSFTAIPYALWQNRGKSNMCVWNRIKK